MNSPDAVLEVEGLNAWYGAARVLFDLTLRVGRGEVVALMGRNGAGKSTAVKTVMALTARRSGMLMRSRALVSASCRRTVASSPTSPWRRTSMSAANRHADFRTEGRRHCGRSASYTTCSPIWPAWPTAAAPK